MRHRVVTKKLNRDESHRKALLRNLSDSLLVKGKVETTLAKAKYVRPYVEKLITRAIKNNNYNTMKMVKNELSLDSTVKKLFEDIAPKLKSKAGGYTRIVRIGNRNGDNAEMARVELILPKESKAARKKTVKAKKQEISGKNMEKTEEGPKNKYENL